MGAAPDQSVTTATGTAWHCDCHSATGTAPGTASGSATHPYHDHVITHWHWQWYCTACTLPWLLRLPCSLQTYYTTLLFLDSPFTVVDAFLLSYRYLPFLVDFFYIFTYFVWWGDFIFRRLLNWVRLLAVKWENKKTSPQNSAEMFVDLSSCAHCLSSWYFGSAHSLEKVMGVISRLGGAGVYILNSYTIGVLNKRAIFMLG